MKGNIATLAIAAVGILGAAFSSSAAVDAQRELPDVRTSAGARQLSLYESRVSTVPTWEFLSASCVSAQSGSSRPRPRADS